ncbi:MAG TPA: endopeptidase La [Thermomicrobiales bacterium]|nr:endopeptidase La [Thermomicrobiales bacterium]
MADENTNVNEEQTLAPDIETGSESPANETATDTVTSASLPVLPLRATVVFPMTVVPLAAAQPRSIRLIDAVASGDRTVVLVLQNDAEQEGAGPGETAMIGTLATIHQMMRVPDGSVRLAVQGLKRVRIDRWVSDDPYLTAEVTEIPETEEDDIETKALMRSTVELFQRLVSLVSNLPDELVTAALNIDEPLQLVYLIATNLRMEPEERQQLLELNSVREKLEQISRFMAKELDLLELGKKIQGEVQEEVGRNQREYYLREQLKAIQKELGESDGQEAEVTALREQIENAGMPEEALREANRELDRLSKLPPAAAEYGVIKTYLDWLVSMPWNVSTESDIDVKAAREILDRDHYNMEKVKDRILEYLAVHRLRNERIAQGETIEGREPILCFVGPPGVGKTSLAQSIADAIGRKFTRMSLGGVRDEAEIRGHRRTYIGAMPGRIIQAIRRAGANDPVFVLDEVDKLGADWRGDPSSALLEVLDPEQNDTFRDHYLDVPFDLSKVMFITTANLLDTIPAPLRDRMEIIQLSGYTDEEKLQIAKRYLVPRQLRANAIPDLPIEWDDESLLNIIQGYTRESGVRNLEREIGTVARKLATKQAAGDTLPERVTPDVVREYLGRPRFFYEELETRTSLPGVAIGVGVTAVGGDIMFIETSKSEGRGNVTITGQLGDVMRESAQAAMSFVRSRASDLGIDSSVFKDVDIHVHVPAGATPKDGPSAGVALTTALVSLLTGIPVREDVAMTGEVTLRGQVLPVGGIKEKSLAAHRAGVTTFILPKRNEADLDDLPANLKDALRFVPVETIDDALAVSLPDEFHMRRQTPDDFAARQSGERIAARASA